MPYAYVENNKIVEILERLPKNWRNVSNFVALDNKLDLLKDLGWYPVTVITPNYNSNTQKLDNWTYEFKGTHVEKIPQIINIPQPSAEELEFQKQLSINSKWEEIRIQRDNIMKTFEWRYTRHQRQTRLGQTPTDNLLDLDNYMQALADITLQTDPFNIVWPIYQES